MGLFKSQLANVVEWEEYRDDVIFYKWNNSEIKKGSRLIIRPGHSGGSHFHQYEGIYDEVGNETGCESADRGSARGNADSCERNIPV